MNNNIDDIIPEDDEDIVDDNDNDDENPFDHMRPGFNTPAGFMLRIATNLFGDNGRAYEQEQQQPPWLQFLHRQISQLVVLDWNVWMGRILVTFAIVWIWDRIHGNNNNHSQQWYNRKEPKQPQTLQQETPETTRGDEDETMDSPAFKADPTNEPTSSLTPSLDPSHEEKVGEQEPQRQEKEQPDEKEKPDDNSKSVTTENSNDPPNDSAIKDETTAATASTTIPNPETVENKLETTTNLPPTSDRDDNLPNFDSNELSQGLDAFWHWYDTQSSLYRIYTIANKDTSIDTIPPYVPNSKRGRVPVKLEVTNTSSYKLFVYWVDYKGRHISKGSLNPRGQSWTQTTWIDHPWVFCDANSGRPLLHFVPYQVLPTIPNDPSASPTTAIGFYDSQNDDDDRTGLFRFTIGDSTSSNTNAISIIDDSLPTVDSTELDTSLKAIHRTLQHTTRIDIVTQGVMQSHATTLQKYLLNILNSPKIWKYRCLRLASPKFASIWDSPLRGLLLAVGFQEIQGWCVLGSKSAELPSHKVQDVALLSYLLSNWQRQQETQRTAQEEQQPMGADGFGRAGFGRAGAM